jgi:hypothetical protein
MLRILYYVGNPTQATSGLPWIIRFNAHLLSRRPPTSLSVILRSSNQRDAVAIASSRHHSRGDARTTIQEGGKANQVVAVWRRDDTLLLIII